jgi:hypothetical protein
MESSDPDLRLEGLRLWVHGRERPDAEDFWDGNWLHVTVRMEASGARIEAVGAFLRINEIAAFAEEVKALRAGRTRNAELRCIEPQLQITLVGDHLGHVFATVKLTPDQVSQSHEFLFETDQTWLTPLLASCDGLLARFPIRGSPSD